MMENTTPKTKKSVIHNARIPFFLTEITFIIHIAYMFYSYGFTLLDEVSFFLVSSGFVEIIILIFAYYSLIQAKLNNILYESFTLILFIASFIIYTDIVCIMINGYVNLRILAIIMNTLSYLLIVLELNLYCGFIYAWNGADYKQFSLLKHLANFFTIAALVTIIINIPMGYLFTISPQGYYVKGNYSYTAIIFELLVLACIYVYIIRSDIITKEKIMLLFVPTIPFINFLVASYFDSPRFHMTIFVSTFFIYTLFFVKKEQQIQARELMISLRDKQLADSEVNALRAKMNPHFIYNTLSSIYGLCRTNPDGAADMTLKLENYLRDNFGKISISPIIPLFEELEHLKYYIDIEQIRFPNLKVEYDTDIDYFMVPSLSIQPMVENAIRHGIQKKQFGEGTIKIKSFEDDKGYYITIEDDGVGIKEDFKNDGKVHLGIKNTRTRLKLLCNGTLSIKALSPSGTLCQVFIPK